MTGNNGGRIVSVTGMNKLASGSCVYRQMIGR